MALLVLVVDQPLASMSASFGAHYAANRAGVCLAFAIPSAFVNKNPVGIAPADYSSASLFEALKRMDLSRRSDRNGVGI